MLELKRETKEVKIILKYSESLGGSVKIDILGEGNLSHHLIEELFGLIDKLARIETIGHQADEWRTR